VLQPPQTEPLRPIGTEEVMLDAFIIEQIRKREEERLPQRIQPRIEPPGRFPGWDRDAGRDGDRHRDEDDRVIILDM
jgi:hypothetical protein